MPAFASSFAVPPVERISKPRSASPRAKSTTSRLSLTLTSARRTLVTGEVLHAAARHAPGDGGEDLVRDRVAPGAELVGSDAVAEEDDAIAGTHVGHVRRVDHRVV